MYELKKLPTFKQSYIPAPRLVCFQQENSFAEMSVGKIRRFRLSSSLWAEYFQTLWNPAPKTRCLHSGSITVIELEQLSAGFRFENVLPSCCTKPSNA